MTIVPDTKDWTWVLARPCPECGFTADAVTMAAVPQQITDNADLWADILRGEVRTRPEPGVWSPLEYACHVRDVCRVFAERVDLMREQDEPRFADWDQDATALQQRYWEQDPAVVSTEVDEASDLAATAFARVRDDDWERRGVRSNGSEFTIDSLARYFLHDLYHHVADLGPR